MEYTNVKKPVPVGREEHSPNTIVGGSTSNVLSTNGQFWFITANGMVRVMESDNEHLNGVKDALLMAVAKVGCEASIVAIHRQSKLSLIGEAWSQSFEMSAEAIAKKNGGKANLSFGWYGGSKDEISSILSHGFSRCKFRQRVVLSALNCCADCLPSSTADENGLMHVLCCRIILANMEAIGVGAEQFQPSGSAFDSGADNLSKPTKYTIRRPYMDSHILPCFVISFRVSRLRGPRATRAFSDLKQLNPSLPDIISILEKYLDLPKRKLIDAYHSDFKCGKIASYQMNQNLLNVVGKEMLYYAWTICRGKKLEQNLDAKIRPPTASVPKRPRNCAAKNSLNRKSGSNTLKLLRELEKHLDFRKMIAVNKVYAEYQKNKINMAQMVRKFSIIVGSDLLVKTAKNILTLKKLEARDRSFFREATSNAMTAESRS